MASPLENEMPVIPPVNAMDGTTPKEDLGTMAVAPAFAASTYEQSLDSDARWALSEGSRHFNEQSQVFFAMRKIAKRLSELNIPYSVVGGMALFLHGLRRFTEDVDILVTRQDLKTIHEKLEGLGYLSTHMGGKHLRDTEYKVKIKFLTTGDYPGDGKK